jgi:Glycine rich protein
LKRHPNQSISIRSHIAARDGGEDLKRNSDSATMSSEPVCASIGANTCLDRKTIGIPAPGYYCKNDLCIKCPVGTYGTDGQNCLPCPFATWSNTVGQKSCGTSFTYSTPGLQKSYIPYGVTKIIVKLWGGGGGSDTSLDPTNYVSHAGGSGGYASCNITVPHSRNVYLIIGGGGGSKALTANAGGKCSIEIFYVSQVFVDYRPL